jgi:hypothetical protein
MTALTVEQLAELDRLAEKHAERELGKTTGPE